MTLSIVDVINAIKLKILVFGPQIHTPSTDPRTAKLQSKRIDIRQKLEALGHMVKYAEDVVDPTIHGPAGNALFQELVLMREYDLIVVLVESPGSIVEVTMIATKPYLAPKAVLFLDGEFSGGLVDSACRNAEDIGAHYETFDYPVDLDDCHLYGRVLNRVTKIQKAKYLL